MAEERVQRRLAAILIADVVGYSRLMESDEEGTRARLRSLHETIIDHNVAEDGGRVVKTSGDGTLVEFPSAVDAVRNAVRTQAAIREYNHDTPEERRIVYRVGINVGDIIVEGDDIFGDGVNVASRLEGLCAPGEIYISGNVYDHVKDKLPVAFEDLGTQTVKNISNPVRMYRVFDAGKTTKTTVPAGPASAAPPPLRDKPSIAVLPFDNLSNDPEQEYFSDGLVEDLITDISKVSGLFVIARNSSFAFKGQPIDVQDVARRLGVKHVVEGSVRKMGSRLRINAQLIDAETGGHLWAERYDGDVENIFDFQDDIRDQIVAALRVALTPAEKSEVQRHLTDSVEAYEFYLRARTEFFKFTPESMFESVRLYEQAIGVDPAFAAAFANLSIVLQTSWSFVLPGCEGALEKALQSAQRAIEIDPQLSLAHSRLGWVQCFLRRHDAAIASFERALELSPNDAEAYAYLSHVYNYLGEPERAINAVKTAFRFDPMLPPNVAFHWGEACFQARQYDEALEKLHECLDKASGFYNARLILAATLSEMGREDEAADELKIVRDRIPDEIIRTNLQRQPYRSNEAHARLINGVRKAGLPEAAMRAEADTSIALSNKPSVAVLPFDNLSGDPEQEYFSDGITEDIIAALSRIRQFFVIARNTTFTYKGQAVDVPTVARDLGVRYVLEGSVRKAGSRIRLTAQLIDGDTGNHIWAEKYDRELEDIFEVQDEITQTVVGAIEPEMDRAERARAKLKNPESLDTWDCFHRGMSEYFDPDKFEKKEHVLQALAFFEKAIESDRAFAPAYAGMSLALSKIAHLGHSVSKTEDADKGIAAGRRAIEIDDDASLPRFALGTAYMMAGRHEEAISQFQQGIDINPSSALNYGNLAISLSWSGRAVDAIAHFETALRLSPRDPLVRPWMDLLAQAHLHIGQYDEALAWRSRAASQPGDGSFWGYGHMVCILGHLGRIDDAKKAIAELLRRKPDYTCKYYRENYPVTDSGYMELYLEGLRKAGIPEG